MTTDLAPDGDLVLVVGPDETRMRVHSLFLKTTSKPFAAMLDPRWKEGQNMLEQEDPVELLLPDDSAEGMKLVCAHIHHRYDLIPKDPEPSVILEVSEISDRWDLNHIFGFAYARLLRPRNLQDSMLLTAAAYYFRDAQAFKQLTKALVLEYNGSYLALSGGRAGSAMPWKVFCEYRRLCVCQAQLIV